jgi:protocatechuate 3,4-dioxygenase beta subunit
MADSLVNRTYTCVMRKIFAILLLVINSTFTNSATAASCSPTESMTEGPYYVSGSNVRNNIIDKQSGTKTALTITIVDSSCKPVSNAQVDIWHANAAGQYSGVKGNSEKYLRGSVITNSKGQATFTTIFPGWYPGRVMHIHVKIWNGGSEVLTTQLFAGDEQVAKIYAKGAYASRGNQNTTLAQDGIYRGLKNPKAHLMSIKIGKSITAGAKIVLP